MTLYKNKISSVIYGMLLLVMTIIYTSCNSAMMSGSPQSFGGINRIIVVADQDMWDGPIGDTLRFYLAAAYPVLPQPEPIFDLQHFTQEEINEDTDRLRFRTMLYLADMSLANSYTAAAVKDIVGEENILKMKESEEKSEIKVSRGRWALNQTVLFFYSEGEEAIVNSIKTKSSSIAELIRKNDESILKGRTFYSGKNGSLINNIKESFGANISIPGDYTLALDDKENNFMWIRKLEKASHVHTNILIHKLAYKDISQLQPEGVKILRDSLGKKYIESGEIDGSYMRVNDVNLPLYHENKSVDDKFALRLKGIWEMSDNVDMMGGAFVSYMIHNEAKNELLFLDAFVFAPGKKKRDMMQGLEQVLSSVKFE
jgi:hypothetical protein